MRERSSHSVRAPYTRALLQMHFCVLLWGFTAILGKVITLTALPLVWWRMTLVTVVLLLLPGFWRGLTGLSLRWMATFSGIGVLVALHWLTFYGSIKLSNASVAASCMALTPVLTALVEPLVVRRRIEIRELGWGVAVIPGVMLVVGGTPSSMYAGIIAGILSVILVSVFASLNKRFVHHGPALAVTGLEMGAGAGFLALIGATMSTERVFQMPGSGDALALLALALGCTLLPFALSLVALRQLSAFTTALVVNLEPVYAILLAIILLGEQQDMDGMFYVGVAVIVAVVVAQPLFANRIGNSRV